MRSLQETVDALEAFVADPEAGLPDPVFLLVSRLTPLVNVDLLIKDGDDRTLLTWREDSFYGPGWHIPGGIVRFKERAADRIRAVARDELGAQVSAEACPTLVREFVEPRATTRAHFISLLFRCVLTSGPDESRRWTTGAPQAGQWCWHVGCPANLITAHRAYESYL